MLGYKLHFLLSITIDNYSDYNGEHMSNSLLAGISHCPEIIFFPGLFVKETAAPLSLRSTSAILVEVL